MKPGAGTPRRAAALPCDSRHCGGDDEDIQCSDLGFGGDGLTSFGAAAQTTIIEERRAPVVIERQVAPPPVVVEAPPPTVETHSSVPILGGTQNTTTRTESVGAGVDCTTKTVQNNTILGSNSVTTRGCE